MKESAFLTLGGTSANISYSGSDGTAGDGHNDVVLTVAGRFDFDGFHQITEDTYTSVSPFQQKQAANTFGWVTLPPQYFERNWPTPYNKLLYDGQSTDNMGTPLTFQVDVVPGQAYEVEIVTGDAGWNHDKQRFWVYDSSVGPGAYQDIDTWGGGGTDYRAVRFTTGTIVESPPGSGRGQISVRLQDLGGVDPMAVILALDVRPVLAVGSLRVLRHDGQPSATSVPADGTTADMYDGSGAPPDTLLTVTATAGTILTPDADPIRWSTQVVSDAEGNFGFKLQRPAGVMSANLMVEETSGMARASLTQAYAPPTSAHAERYHFGVFGSPVQTNPEFIEVVPQTIYNATRGYGWASRVAGVNRKDPSMSALRTDLNYASNATFRVNVTGIAEYHVRVYHANPKYNGMVSYIADNFDVWAEGVFQYNVASVAAGGTEIREFTIAPGADGTSGTPDIRFWDRGGADGNFVVSGIEIWTGSDTPPDQAPLLVGQWAAGAERSSPWSAGAERGSLGAMGTPAGVKLEAALLASTVAEAAARWSSVGLTPAQSTALSEAQFVVADLGGSYLGLADIPAYRVRIDDDAAGLGWSVVPGHSSLVIGRWSLDNGQRTNDQGQMTSDGVDLLTAIMHEMGHLLGYGHSDTADDLMAPLLDAGRSRAGRIAEAAESLGQTEWRMGRSSSVPNPASRISHPASRISRLASRVDDVFTELGEEA